MIDQTRDLRWHLRWALPASLILHALIIALLIYSPSRTSQQPQQEQTVNVALVPPPDQPKPAPAPLPKRDKVEKPPEPKVEKPPPPEKQPSRPAPIEVLRPVFQFGDKDAGPRKSLDGASAQDNAPAPAKDTETKSAPSPVPGEQPDAAKDAEKPANVAKSVEQAQEKPPTEDADKQALAAPMPLTAAGDDGEIALPASAEKPQQRPANVPKPSPQKALKSASATRPSSATTAKSQSYSGLPGVRRLHSQGATGDALATTAMDGMPRDQRIAKLCASALQQQLLDASYVPYLVPLKPLKAGNILDAPDTAFRTPRTWYRLGFRCEVDTDATKVVSFAFRVGAPIPPDEWARLGLSAR